MMTHSYYGGGGDLESFPRSRPLSHADYYGRVGPYDYYEQAPHHDNRSEYPGRQITRRMIHGPENPVTDGQRSRKRISVACRRCRKRKIKCSGDLGDGLGCSACRHAGTDGAHCAFIRVGAKECCEVLPGIEVTPMTTSMSAPSITSQYSDTQSNAPYGDGSSNGGYGTNHQSQRPSLPTLHTRPAFPTDYGSQYENSALDVYSYASSTIPRQDSFTSAYGLENYRSWATTAPMSSPVTATYYEPTQTYSFGSLQVPSFPSSQQPAPRLPSVTAESFAPFHMSPLNASLPAHTINERRLPIPAPYILQYLQSQPPMPQIRPLGSYTEPRVHINGIHSRNAMPWSQQNSSMSSRAGSMSSYAPSSELSISSAPSTTAVSEPVLGYQWSMAAPNAESSSPEISPTSGVAAADSFSSSSSTASLPPAVNFGYASISSASTPQGLHLPLADDRQRSSDRAPPSLFSFSTESSDRQSAGSEHAGNDHNMVARGPIGYPAPVRHSQLNHAASADSFSRHPTYEEQRPSTTHRMSLSNLNANY